MNKTFFTVCLLIVMLAFYSVAGNRIISLEGTVLSADSYAVVVPSEPTITEKKAAKELVAFLKQMTGHELPIVSENEQKTFHAIFIGRNSEASHYGFEVDYEKLGVEGIHIELKGGNLICAGNQRGVLYAVYSFLEEYLGCQWFALDCSVIPDQGQISLDDFKKVYIPPFEYRDTDYPVCRSPEFGVRNKLNGKYSTAGEEWGNHISYSGFVHTFSSLLPPEKYGAEHPEYYSLFLGKRTVEGFSQLCLTNPDVKRLVAEEVLRLMRENPEATIFSVSQNDNEAYCHCENCKALAKYEGSESGPMIHFVNYIADAVREEFPDKIIDTLAYRYTRKPPKHVKPAPNVCVRLCTIECCFSHPIDSCPQNQKFIKDIIGWSKICKRLHIWDYVINFGHCVQPFPNFRVIQPNIDFFMRHGVTGVYEEANYFSHGGELSELRSYVLAKCLWEPSYDMKKAIYEFTEAYYGAAGVHIRKYLDTIHQVSENPDGHFHIYTAPTDYLNDPKMLDEADAALQAAADAVKDNETLLHRVQLVMLPVIYTRFMLSRNYHLEGNSLVSSAAGTTDLKKLDFFKMVAERVQMTQISEVQTMKAVKDWVAAMRKWSETEYIPSVSVNILENDYTSITVIPSVGGRVWRAVDKTSGFEMLRVEGNDKYGFTLSASGIEEYATPDYRGIGHDTQFAVIESSKNSVVMRGTLKDGSMATRTISLLPDKSGFSISTQYTAETEMPERACRIHPEFYVERINKAVLLVRQSDGSYREYPIQKEDIVLEKELLPVGEWSLRFPYKKGTVTLTNLIETENVSRCFVNSDYNFSRVNLEMVSEPKTLSPGNGPHLTNTYIFKWED